MFNDNQPFCNIEISLKSKFIFAKRSFKISTQDDF